MFNQKLKNKLLELTNERSQRKLDLTSLLQKHKANFFEYKIKPLAPPLSRPFIEFVKMKDIVNTMTPSLDDGLQKSIDEVSEVSEEQQTDTPDELLIDYSDNIPKLEEIDSKLKKSNDDDFVVVNDENDFGGNQKVKLRHLLVKPEAIVEKREIKDSLSKASNLIDKYENETSAERTERINKGLKKVMQLVGIMGQIDNYFTDKTRHAIKKLALLCDYDENQRRG